MHPDSISPLTLPLSHAAADSIATPARIETLAGGPPVALLPPGWKVESLAAQLPKVAPTFREGVVTLHDTDSFGAYVLRHATPETVVYAERLENGGGRIVAVIDDGAPKSPGRRVDRAVLEISADPRFASWVGIMGKAIGQKPFMEFIEDHDREFVSPGGAQMRTYVNRLEVKKLVQFKSVEKEDSAAADVSLLYETETSQVNELKFPQQFTIAVPVMRNCPAIQIECRIRFRVEDGKVTFTIKLDNLYALVEAAWSAVIQELRAAMPDVPVLSGKWN